MTSERKRRGVAFWATVTMVVVPLIYLLSFGPVCWLYARRYLRIQSVNQIYPESLMSDLRRSKVSAGAIHWYANFGAPKNIRIIVAENGWVGHALFLD